MGTRDCLRFGHRRRAALAANAVGSSARRP